MAINPLQAYDLPFSKNAWSASVSASAAAAPRPLALQAAQRPSALTGPNPLREFAIRILFVYLMLRISMAHEFGVYHGFDSRYSFVCLPALLLASVLSGSLREAAFSRIGLWFFAFVGWMIACVPTSTWKGGSFSVWVSYLQIGAVIFLATACLAVTSKAQKIVMWSLAVAMSLFVLVSFLSAADMSGRMTLAFGSYGNPNDLALHLVFLAPAVVFAILDSGSYLIKAFFVTATLAPAVVIFFRTGSRGGLLALCAVLLVVFLSLSWWRKIVALLLLFLVIPATLLVLPRNSLARYKTIFSSDESIELGGADNRMLNVALSSRSAREATLKESIAISRANPVFGVGPGQYSVYTSEIAKAMGVRANWIGTHNTYTQVSSEMGFVGLLAYMGALIGAGISINRSRRLLKRKPDSLSTYRLAACLQVSWVAYSVGSLFSHLAYTQYLPLLCGMAVALARSLNAESPLAEVENS